MAQLQTKVLIIGAGPAGYTAAIYAARANLKPILVQGMQPGGQLTVTLEVENYPGFADPVQGPWLMEQMQKQAENVGAEVIFDSIETIDLKSHPFHAVGDSEDEYLAESVIIATGAQARWLGIPSEARYRGFGVSACATCDGFFFRGKTVAVIGGGNAAIDEALYLANLCEKVFVVHRRDKLRGEKVMHDRLFRHPKVEMVWDSVVEEILGTGDGSMGNPLAVNALRVRNVKSGDVKDIPLDGVFIAIGHDPATALFKGQLETDGEGYLITAPDSTATTIPGVFAAGDVRDKKFRQAVTAAGMGCMAALEAEHWLAAQED